nr:hypothetical protein [Tanacetum cinerariifolium]
MTNTQTPPPATTVVNSTGVSVTNTVANHATRPEKFNGHNFKRWQQKMFFYLTILDLARFLKETVPQVEPPTEGQSSNAQAVQAVEAWKHSDFLCHNNVLNEDVGTKKFVVARFLDYKMVDSKNVISQFQDLQVDFKNYLKHKQKEMSVEDFVVRLHIEEDNKLALKDTCTPNSTKANMIEHAGSSSRSNPKRKGKDKRKNDKKSKGKSEYLAPKDRIENIVIDGVDMIAMVSDVCAMISKSKGKSEYLAPKDGIVKQKFQGTCYNYDQLGHRAANCKMPNRVNPRQENIVNDGVDMIAMVSDVCAMISK